MSRLVPPFAADSPAGRTLIALRAGAMTNAALEERFPGSGALNDLRKGGFVEQCEGGWQLTAAGRAVCPLRNPAAATVATPPAFNQAGWLARKASASTASVRFPDMAPAMRPARPAAPSRPMAELFSTPSGGHDMSDKPRKRTAIDEVRDQLATAPEGLSRGELIRRTSLQKHNVDNAMYQLIRQGEAKRTKYGSIALLNAPVVPAKAAEPEAKPAAPVIEEKAPEVFKAPEPLKGDLESAPAPIKFSIDSDGQLAIIDGNEVLVLPPDATRRLGHFLGCFEPTVGSTRHGPWLSKPRKYFTAEEFAAR